MKTPDAVLLATAINAVATGFIRNDSVMRGCTDLDDLGVTFSSLTPLNI